MLPSLYRYPWMTEEMEAFREQARRFVGGELTPHLDAWRRQGFVPQEAWRALGQMGFLLPELAERWGGAGATVAHQLVVQDELAKAEMRQTAACTASPPTTFSITARRLRRSAGCHGWQVANCSPVSHSPSPAAART